MEKRFEQIINPTIQTNLKKLETSSSHNNFIGGAIRNNIEELDVLDDNRKMDQVYRDKYVSVHETGHWLAAEALGWKVTGVDIIEQSGRGGVTKFQIPRKSWKELLMEKIAICFASEVAETMFDHQDHRGCGMDYFMARQSAQIYANLAGGSVKDILSMGKQMARQVLNRIGFGIIDQKSWHLYQQRSI